MKHSEHLLEVLGTHEFVMRRWMMFGEIVGAVLFARRPIQIELSLRDAILEPVVSHVERFGSFHSYGGVEDTVRCGVVGFDRCS